MAEAERSLRNLRKEMLKGFPLIRTMKGGLEND